MIHIMRRHVIVGWVGLLIFMSMFCLPSEAYQLPSLVPLADAREVEQWCQSAAEQNKVFGYLSQDIIIDRPVTWKQLAASQKDIFLDFGTYKIRVVGGGVLVIDHPNLILQSRYPMIQVESGGRLELQRGDFAPVMLPDVTYVILKEQSEMFWGSGFTGLSKSTIRDERTPANQQPEESEAPETSETSKPPEESEAPKPPESQEPESTAPTEGTEPPDDTPPTEEVKPEVNPQIKSTHLTSISSKGEACVVLQFPDVIHNLTAVYLYRSDQSLSWKRASFQMTVLSEADRMENVQRENFLDAFDLSQSPRLVYRFITDYRPLYLKVQFVFSDRTVETKPVKIEIPYGTVQGQDNKYDHDIEDIYDGNRGGVQSEGVRETLASPETEYPETQLQRSAGAKPAVPAWTEEGGIWNAANLPPVQVEMVTPHTKAQHEAVEKSAASMIDGEPLQPEESEQQEPGIPEQAVREEEPCTSKPSGSFAAMQGFQQSSILTAVLLLISYLGIKRRRKS